MRPRRGNYSMLMGVFIFTILGFCALALDISLITMAEQQAQATADAAAHAALIAYKSNRDDDPDQAAVDAADFMINVNPVAMGIATRDAVRLGTYTPANGFCEGCSAIGNVNAVEVTLSRQGNNAVDLLLAPMFGVNTHDVTASALTAQQQRALMLVQDFSCSMNASYSQWTNGDPAAIDLSRQANFLFLEYLITFPQEGDMLGLSGYAQYGAKEGGGSTLDMNDPPWAQLSVIEDDLPYLTGKFAGICDTWYGCPDGMDGYTSSSMDHPEGGDIGWCTNPSIAMLQAVTQLANGTDETFFRGMVVMSDGVFNCGGGNSAADDAADLAYDDYDIHIWTILFSNGSINPTQMQSMVRGLGFFQNSPSASDLPDMYQNVAESLPMVMVD
ncbi:MAG: hypothetical protein KTR31_33395 [Myxococcales bacterium]|nr:hypothetical protein [Myxococcales bacterium]